MIDTATFDIVSHARPGPPSAANRTLLAHHRHELEVGSGIAPAVIAKRGYFSATREDLLELGFAEWQALPGLVAPRYNLAGRLDGFLLKPDQPRIDAETGKPIKYESAVGVRPSLDIHPDARVALKDPTVTLWITEGHKKADSLLSRGIPCVSITGTFMFLNKRMIVSELDEIFTDGRKIVVAYDSDSLTKEGVAEAQHRLCAALKRRGAKVHVARLPAGPNGEKQGVDDLLVNGMSIEDLEALVQPWDGLGPGIWLRDPHAGADKDAVIIEQALVISLLGGIIRNRHLTHMDKIVALQSATLCRNKVADGAVEPGGHIRLSPAEIAEDYRGKPEPGSPAPAADRFGRPPLMSRKSVSPAIDHAIERGLITATPITIERSHRSGAKYQATSWLMTPPASLSAALSPWANWCPEEPKLRKPRTLREPCPHCGETHPIQRQDWCTGCGTIISERVISPDPPEGYVVDSPGEKISPEENAPSPPGPYTYREKKFPRTPEEPAWLVDAPEPEPDLAETAQIQADLDLVSRTPEPSLARTALHDLERDLARIAHAKGRQPVPKPPSSPPPPQQIVEWEVWP